MAFGGVLLFYLLFLLLFGMAAAGVGCLIAALVLLIRHLRAKRSGKPAQKRWLVLAAVLALVGVLGAAPYGFVLWRGAQPKYMTIETPSGNVEVLQDTAFAFGRAVDADDIETVRTMLEETPELLWYSCIGDYLPMGEAVRHGSADVLRYFLDLGLDVNGYDEYPSIAIACSAGTLPDERLDPEIILILLEHHPDVDTAISAMPPVQYVLRYITEDAAITEDDLDLLAKFLAESPDLTAANGAGQDAPAYFEICLTDYAVPADYAEQIDLIRGMLTREETP